MILKDFINAQPALAADVTAGNDGAIATWLNTPSIPTVGTVSRPNFAEWCGSTGLRAEIQDAANTAGDPLRSISLTLLDFLQGGVSDALDFSRADNQAMLQSWVTAGKLTAAQQSELLTLATSNQSPAQVNGFGVVSIEQIAQALRG